MLTPAWGQAEPATGIDTAAVRTVTSARGHAYPGSTVPAAGERYNAGMDALAAGRTEAAAAAFRASLRHEPGFVRATDMLAVAHRRLGQLDSAEHYYRRSIALYPEGAFAYANLAVVYLLRGRPAEAVPLYRRQVALDPADPEGYYGLGNAFANAGRLDSATVYVRRAQAMYRAVGDPHLADAHQLLALVLQAQGRDAEARAEVTAALELGAEVQPKLLAWYEATVAADREPTAADFARAEPAVLAAADVLLGTGPDVNPGGRVEAARTILTWLVGTPRLSLELTAELTPFTDEPRILPVFLAAFAKTGLAAAPGADAVDLYTDALTVTCAYYREHRAALGEHAPTAELATLSPRDLRRRVRRRLR